MPSFGWLLLKNKKRRPTKTLSPYLSIFSMGRLFCIQSSPPCAIYSKSRVPGGAYDVASMFVAPGRAFDSDERSQRRRRTSAGLEKNSLKNSLIKNTIELTPRCKPIKTMRVQRLPLCGEHARHAGTGDGLPRTPAEAVAGVANFFPPIFLMSVSTPNAASTARIFANRACGASHMTWLTRASPRDGRRAATGGGRGGGRCRRCQKKIASTIMGTKSNQTHPPS